MKKSTILETLEKQISALKQRGKAKDDMMESMVGIMSFSDDQQASAKYVKELFNFADVVDDYRKQEMRMIAFLEHFAALIRESAQEISLTEETS